MIEHIMWSGYLKMTHALYDFNEQDVWSMFHSFCFDFRYGKCMVLCFMAAVVVIVPQEADQDVTLFSKLIVEQNITVLNQTPSAFYVLQDHVVENIEKRCLFVMLFLAERHSILPS
jgi:non-ribosomal peptide synthetase component F